MPKTVIGGAFNIPLTIVRAAEKLGLEAMATGGGLDYIYRALGKNTDGSPRVAILGDPEDAGSPDSLSSRAEVHILLSEDWTDQVSIPVATAKKGLELLVSLYTPY